MEDDPPAEVPTILDIAPVSLVVINELAFASEAAMNSWFTMKYVDCSTIAEIVRLFNELPLNEDGKRMIVLHFISALCIDFSG
jgi:hypothetical protein